MPPSQLRGRPALTTFVYEDAPDGGSRVAATYTRSPWSPEDRALMLAYEAYLASLCEGCGHPKATAWHPDNDGWFEITREWICHACTAMDRHGADPDHLPAATRILRVSDTRDYGLRPLPRISEAGELLDDD